MKRIILLLFITISSIVLNANNNKPFVIPEIRHWKSYEGNFIITNKTRIVYPKDNIDLFKIAELLSSDYEKMFDVKLKVKDDIKNNSDIIFEFTDNDSIGNEGYIIDIDDNIVITANNKRGAIWATRTILQIAEQNNQSLPKGKIIDFPDYEMRSFMLDCGRKFIPMHFLHEYVEFMSYYKMNTFHIHLNDNAFKQYFDNDWNKTPSGFRLESDYFPGLTSRDGFYTKEEFIELQQHAETLGVEIIPEFDIPAHSLAFVHYRPELGSKEYGSDHLDLFKEETYNFVDSLFMEYLGGENPVFRGPRFHVGTDEYSNRDSLVVEKFRYFTDHCIREAEKYGKQSCVWGALTHAKGKTPVKVENVLMYAWYNGYANPKEMIDLGYDLISIPDGLTYIVPAAGYYYDYLNCEYLYNNWTPATIGNLYFEERHPQIKGGSFAVWNDHAGNGISFKDIHYRSYPAMQTMSTKMWTGENITFNYNEFNENRLLLSDAPGLNIAGRFIGVEKVVLEIDILKSNKKTNIKEIGFDYSVSFDIEYIEEEKGTILFQSRDAEFYLTDPIEGKLGFSRDGYLNTFNYKLIPSDKVNITIKGNQEVTELYIDGSLKETLNRQTIYHNEGKSKMYYIRTLVFPLEKSGDFKSKITNLKVLNK